MSEYFAVYQKTVGVSMTQIVLVDRSPEQKAEYLLSKMAELIHENHRLKANADTMGVFAKHNFQAGNSAIKDRDIAEEVIHHAWSMLKDIPEDDNNLATHAMRVIRNWRFSKGLST